MQSPPMVAVCERKPSPKPCGHTPRRLTPCALRPVKVATYAAAFANAANRNERIAEARKGDTPPAPPLLVLALGPRALLVSLGGCTFDTRNLAGVCVPPPDFKPHGVRKDGKPRKRAAAVSLKDMVRLDGCAYDEGACLGAPEPFIGPMPEAGVDWFTTDDMNLDVETAELAAAWYWHAGKMPALRPAAYVPSLDERRWRGECRDAEHSAHQRAEYVKLCSAADVQREFDRRYNAEDTAKAQAAEAFDWAERKAPARENVANVLARMGGNVVSLAVQDLQVLDEGKSRIAGEPIYRSPVSAAETNEARSAALAVAAAEHAAKFAKRQAALAAAKADISELTDAAARRSPTLL
jgi:hypothetical protein